MPLFLFRHQHSDATCPTNNPQLVQQLVQHTSRAGAAPFGVLIHGEAVLRGEHSLYMILEADSEEKVREYVRPFAMVGSAEIQPALTCAQVAEVGCGAPAPAKA